MNFDRAGGVASRFRARLENPTHPLNCTGEARGFNPLVRARDVLGPYLGILAGLKQAWAEANRDLLIRFLRAYAKGLEVMYDEGIKTRAGAALQIRGPTQDAD